jgi:MoaA/NifB/PqqE/SkfB family radical SAM enzyme
MIEGETSSLVGTKQFQRVYLEIGNICNLQCSFCPIVDRVKYQMDEERLRLSLRQIKPFAERVCFHVMGEPLAHPHFCRFVEIAAQEGVPLEITTNGTLLEEGRVAALLDKAVVQVNFSLQAFGDNFPEASPLIHWRKVLAYLRKAMAERPDQYLNLRLWNQRESQEMAKENEPLLRFLENELEISISRGVNLGLRKSKKIVNRMYLHFDSRFEWPHPDAPEGYAKGTCWGTRSHVAVLAEGTIVPCCLDKEARLSLGSLEEGFATALESERFLNMREGFEKGELRESLCRRCGYVNRFSKNLSRA